MSTTQDAPADARTKLYEFECPECGYSHTEAKSLATETQIYCGICAGDTGDDVRLHRWLPGERAMQPEPAPTIESLIAEIEAAGWDLTVYGYAESGIHTVYIHDAGTGEEIAHEASDVSLKAALQEALTTARQAVQL